MEINSPITQVPTPPPRPRHVIWPWIALAAAVLLFLLCWGCWKAISGFRDSGADADAAVERFHASLNSEHYEEIYAATDDLFRRASSRDSAVQLFEGVHRKLGKAG